MDTNVLPSIRYMTYNINNHMKYLRKHGAEPFANHTNNELYYLVHCKTCQEWSYHCYLHGFGCSICGTIAGYKEAVIDQLNTRVLQTT